MALHRELEAQGLSMESLSNIVTDYTIDGGELPELTFPQIQELRKDYSALEGDLIDAGGEEQEVGRLHELGETYGVLGTQGKTNLISIKPPDSIAPFATSSHSGKPKLHIISEERPGPRYDRSAPQVLASCARALKKHMSYKVFDDVSTARKFKYESKDNPKGKLCTNCPVLAELGECSVRQSFHDLLEEQDAMLYREGQRHSGAGGKGHGSFMKVWSQYNGSLGGGTPRNPLKVPGIVHQ